MNELDVFVIESGDKYWIKTASITRVDAIKAWENHPKYSPNYTLVEGTIRFTPKSS